MEWLENDRSYNRTQFDGEVVICHESQDKNARILFKFRKNSIFKIVTNENHIVLAKDGYNIYFKASNPKQGFKLGKYGVNTTIFKLKENRLKLTEENFGEYNLEYDTKLGLHYICLMRKLEEPSLNWEGK